MVAKGAASVAAATKRRVRGIGALLLFVWSLYVVVFHYLANLPVDAAMPRGVLARFWMQADVLTCIVFGAGVRCLMQYVEELITATSRAASDLVTTAPPTGSVSAKEKGGKKPAVASSPAVASGSVSVTASPTVASRPPFSSPLGKLNIVFVVVVVGMLSQRLPFVDHAGLYEPL